MTDYHIISFPGLGISEMKVPRLAFQIGNISVAWYGIIITLGIVLAVLYVLNRTRRLKIISDDVLDVTIVTVLLALVGARAYYVLTTLDTGHYESFLDVIAIWEGGIAIYGAIIGGAIGAILSCYFKKIRILPFLDCTVPAVMLGQAIGRWGNFMNGEAYGSMTQWQVFTKYIDLSDKTKNLFCRMGIVNDFGETEYWQPTFLYESLWNLIGFLLINYMWGKRKFDGQILAMYLAWYGFGRFFIEGLRTDSLPIGSMRISQVVGLLCFVGGILYLILGKVLHLPLTAENAYTPAKQAQMAERAEEQPKEKTTTEQDTTSVEQTTLKTEDGSVVNDLTKTENNGENDNGNQN